MTKARSIGEKRRGKRGRPAKEGVEREPSGKVSRNPEATARRRENAMRTALQARAKDLGLVPAHLTRVQGETDEEFAARRNARDRMIAASTPILNRPWLGCAAGRAIAGEIDVQALWDVIQEIRRVRMNYLRSIDAPKDQAKAANLLVAPSRESGGADAGHVRSEPLTDEEFAGVAERAWHDLRDILEGHHPMAVRFTVDRVCSEVPGADSAPVPKRPLLEILRHVLRASKKWSHVAETA